MNKTLFNRDFYKSFYVNHQGAVAALKDDGVIEAYFYKSTKPSHPYGLLVFGGKRSKPDFSYIYRTEQEREDKLTKTYDAYLTQKAAKQARREMRKSESHSLKVGDILSERWGYDQTNYDFYQVTRVVSDKTVELRHIAAKHVDDDSAHFTEDTLVPDVDNFTGWGERERSGKPFQKRVSKNNYVSISSYSCALPWSGKPCHATNPLFGH